MRKKNRPFLISITGGIASGKSYFSQIIEKNGLPVFYADKIGHNILDLESTKKELVKNFGCNILINGKINRKKLGKIVFNHKEKLQKLNQITHKKILGEINSIMEKSQEKYVFFEIPLLFELHLQQSFHFNILIKIDEEIRIQRLIKRDKIPKKRALQIINSQMKDSQKENFADLIIDNSFSQEYLKLQVDVFLQTLRFLKKRKIKSLI